MQSRPPYWNTIMNMCTTNSTSTLFVFSSASWWTSWSLSARWTSSTEFFVVDQIDIWFLLLRSYWILWSNLFVGHRLANKQYCITQHYKVPFVGIPWAQLNSAPLIMINDYIDYIDYSTPGICDPCIPELPIPWLWLPCVSVLQVRNTNTNIEKTVFQYCL